MATVMLQPSPGPKDNLHGRAQDLRQEENPPKLTGSSFFDRAIVGSSNAWWVGLQQVVLTWARGAGLKLAPAGHVVRAEDLIELATQSIKSFELTGVPYAVEFSKSTHEQRCVLVRNAAHAVLDRVQQRRALTGEVPGRYWNVICEGIVIHKTPSSLNKNDRRSLKREAARGRPVVKDSNDYRIIPKEDRQHFTRYMNELLDLDCAPLLLELKLFPNAKELTESFACFAAARAHLSDICHPRDPNVTVICIGDGATPRTAALFAFRTSWQCVSVDPLLEELTGDTWSSRVNRLTVLSARIQDVPPMSAESVLLVLPHAHVDFAECLRKVTWRKSLAAVAMPCCNYYQALGLPDATPVFEGSDMSVVSPHRLIRIWRWTARDETFPRAVPRPEMS